MHPEAFLKRWEVYQNGERTKMPLLDEEHLQELGALLHKNLGVMFLPSDDSPSLMLTGGIPKENKFLRKDFHFSISRLNLVTK